MNEPLSKDIIHAALSRFFTDPVVSKTQFFKMGAENTTALLEGNFGSIVLRVWGEQHSRMGPRLPSDIQGELAFMDACRSAQLPVPKLYISLAGHESETLADGRTYSVMDYVEGEEPNNFTQPMIEALASAVAKMNVVGETFRFPTPRSLKGTVIDLAQERFQEYRAKGIQDEFVDYLHAKLKQDLSRIDLTKLPFGPIHGDIIYQNIKYVGERLNGIFDFDDCRESYLIEDIAKIFYFGIEDPARCVLGDSLANATIFLEEYQRIRPLDASEKAAFPVISSARFLYELLKFHLHGAKQPRADEILKAKKAAYQKFKPLFEEDWL